MDLPFLSKFHGPRRYCHVHSSLTLDFWSSWFTPFIALEHRCRWYSSKNMCVSLNDINILNCGIPYSTEYIIATYTEPSTLLYNTNRVI